MTARTAPLQRTWILSLALVALAACGGGGGGGDSADVLAGNFFPLAVGDRWAYADEQGRLVTRRATQPRSANGETGVLVLTEDGVDGNSETVLIVTGGGVKEVTLGGDETSAGIGPVPLMRFPVVAGDTFVQADEAFDSGIDADGDGASEVILVKAEVTVIGLEAVSTPLGRIDGCLHQRTTVRIEVRYTRGSTVVIDSTADDWYGPDIGPVRSTVSVSSLDRSESRTLGLVAYQVGARRSESVPPTVLAVMPAEGSRVASPSQVAVVFSEPLQRSSVDGQVRLVAADGSLVPGTLQVAGSGVTLGLGAPLAPGRYTLLVGTGIEDLAGNRLVSERQFVFEVSGPGA